MSTSFDIAEINRNTFIGKTGRIVRPWADDPDTVYFDEASLREQQRRWDQAKAWDDRNAKLGADRRAQLDADRAADAAKRQAKARGVLEAALEREFMSNAAATIADWEAVKDQKVREALMASNPVAEARAELIRAGAFPRF